jgi:TolB protein
MIRASVLLLGLGIVLALGLPAVKGAEPDCPDPAFCVLEERQLTISAADQLDPAISGNHVVYTDSRNSDNDIYWYDLQTNQEFQITSGGGDQMLSAISGEWVAYTDFGRGNADAVVYNILTEQSLRVTENPANQRKPTISGHRLVYEDDRAGDWNIYLYDLETHTETQLTTDASNQRNPVISGNIVVWEDYRSGNADVYMMNLETGEVRQVTFSSAQETDPYVDGDVIVFFSNERSVGDVYYYRVSTGETVSVTGDSVAFERNPTVSGDFVVFESYADGNSHLWVHSISLGITRQVTTAPANQYLHDLSGNRVVYTDDRNGNLDIYAATFSFGTHAPQIAEILQFFDESVDAGTLVGDGPGHSGEGRLKALRNMLRAAADLINAGNTAGACQQLRDAYLRTDGNPRPPDFVTGPAALELAARILELRAALGCVENGM